MSNGVDPREQQILLSAMYLNPNSGAWRGMVAPTIGLCILAVYLAVVRGWGVAALAFTVIAGFGIFFVLVSDTWDLIFRRARFQWAYVVMFFLGAAALAVLIIANVGLVVVIVPGLPALVFLSMKMFGML